MKFEIFIFQDIKTALAIFKVYYPLWQEDHDEELENFLSKNPYVSEFETKIKYYENLSLNINSQPEFIIVRPLAIFTGMTSFFPYPSNCSMIVFFLLFRTFKICI